METGSVEASEILIRRAGGADAGEIARLLDDFNTEFDAPTPGVAVLAENTRRLLVAAEVAILLGGNGPDAIALIRFRPSVWTGLAEAHLQELYVAPKLRGRGVGRTLLEASIDLAHEAGATTIDLATSTTDTAARALYESAGFSNREWEPEGPSMLYYEREI